MTIIKQKAVSSERHGENVRRYLNSKDALIRTAYNVGNPELWYAEMERTRKMHGHDRPARKGGKNTIMYHQILAFLPEECSCNGGKMTAQMCLDYAMTWIRQRYPDQQVAFALHEESDKQGRRYAVHMAINRTNLRTGRRLDEGKSRFAAVERANAVRDMDSEWDLQQVEEGKQNSKIRKRQPRAEEKLLGESGRYSYKHALRTLVEQQVELPSVKTVDDLCSRLEDFRFSVSKKAGDILVTDNDAKDLGYGKCTFSLKRLDGRFAIAALGKAFAKKTDRPAKPKDVKADYLARVGKAIAAYRDIVAEHGDGAPRFKVPRAPEELKGNKDVNLAVAKAVLMADRIRAQQAGSSVPKTLSGRDGAKPAGTARPQSAQPRSITQQRSASRTDPGRNR